MSRKRKRPARGAPLTKAIRKHLDVACEHVYWASGIVDCCVYATASKLLPKNDRPNFEHALEGAYALLQKAGGNLLDVLDDDMPSDGGEP
jgi:hypothetical protein